MFRNGYLSLNLFTGWVNKFPILWPITAHHDPAPAARRSLHSARTSAPNPYHRGVSGIRPVAMERTLGQLTHEKGIADGSFEVPCTVEGAPRTH